MEKKGFDSRQLSPYGHDAAGLKGNDGDEYGSLTACYVIFLDSDDIYDARLLAYTYDCAEQADADVVLFDVDVIQLPEKKRLDPAWMKQTQRLPRDVFAGADAPDSLFQMLNP